MDAGMSKGRIVFNGALAGVISTLVFTVVHQIFISPIWFMLWAMVAAGALVALLGLNVSAIGLVAIPGSALFVVAELFGLIVALNAVYAAVFLALQWQRLAPVSPGGKSPD